MEDTICALATAPGRAGLAVIRLSGPKAHQAVAALLRRDLPPPRQMMLRTLHDAAGVALDSALVAVFPERESFTGEAAAELHLHGAPVVVSAVLRALTGQPGLRLAEPGEFTRRALEGGRLDLAQVEGLGDLLAAETEAQRRQAFRVMQGGLSAVVEGWRRDLVRARALVEATIDFADEDVPQDIPPEVAVLVGAVQAGIGREIAGAVVAERIRDGFEVAILGRPNAGKSSLLNALARREVAITSEVAGTTRDIIELRLDLGGLPVTLLDTAGLRETEDAVERIGVARALERARAADLRLFLLAPGEALGGLPVQPGAGDIVVLSKADLRDGVSGLLAVSATTGLGLGELVAEISRRLGARAAGAGLAIRERQRRALEAASAALVQAQEGLSGGRRVELVAEELRLACRALEILLGRVDVEEIFDEIFASFCLGK